VGTLLDTTIFIELERATRELPADGAMTEVGSHLTDRLGGTDEEVAIAAITASELLHGVHRAGEEHRGRREAFVEAVLGAFPTLPFDLLAARVHARIWAGLASSGTDIGAHDRIVASTAISAGWGLASANTRHFDRIPGLRVTHVSLTAS
jgi:tRNA(fMet)-specific endonuclease VapC